MSELRDPTLLSLGSRIVGSGPREPGRRFGELGQTGWLAWCHFTVWLSAKRGHFWNIVDAPCCDDIWMLVESARGRYCVSESSALPLSDVSPECEGVVPMSSWSAPASGRFDDCDDFSWASDEPVDDMPRSWRELLRDFEASPLAKRRTAKPATKTSRYLCRSLHGQFLDNDTNAFAFWLIT